MTTTATKPIINIERGLRMRIAGRRCYSLYLRIDWQTGKIDVVAQHESERNNCPARAWYRYETYIALSTKMSNTRIREIVADHAYEIAMIRAGWSETLNNDKTRMVGTFDDDAWDALRMFCDRIEQERWDADSLRGIYA